MENVLNSADVAKTVAKYLLKVEAVKLNVANPFQWASGWSSPIYCDNRVALSFPEARKYITKALAETIKVQFPDVEAIAGVATAGIPQGALVANELELPFLYVRSKPKSHGMTNLIEGKITPGQKVVVIEDLISTGGSSLKASEGIKQAQMEVLGMCAIFTYGFQVADDNFSEAGIVLHTLSDYSVLIEEALESGYIQSEDLDTLKSWRQSPGEWGK
jgi:orotate phosphoribosyltransferase